MDVLKDIFEYLKDNWEAMMTAAIAISLLIPGDQPEKAFYRIAEFLEKLSGKNLKLPGSDSGKQKAKEKK